MRVVDVILTTLKWICKVDVQGQIFLEVRFCSTIRVHYLIHLPASGGGQHLNNNTSDVAGIV